MKKIAQTRPSEKATAKLAAPGPLPSLGGLKAEGEGRMEGAGGGERVTASIHPDSCRSDPIRSKNRIWNIWGDRLKDVQRRMKSLVWIC